MNTEIKLVSKPSDAQSLIILTSDVNAKHSIFTAEQRQYIVQQIKDDKTRRIDINQFNRWVHYFVVDADGKKDINKSRENFRAKGYSLLASLKRNKLTEITIVDEVSDPTFALALAEGIALSNYEFIKYKHKKDESSLRIINIVSKKINAKDILHLTSIVEGTCFARTLVNEPHSYLTASRLGAEVEKIGKEMGFKVEVFNEAKIETLKMEGLRMVNRGSMEPPTFTVMEWKPRGAVNKQPIVLVGKGVVFDTGGVNIKSYTGMIDMKCDMAGAAAVVGAFYAIAKSKLPIHVIGLVPSTDNRTGEDAMLPGDIITMPNGVNVEVLNTDAEGRLILADALIYAQKYNPQLVIDLATLTGAAAKAIGKYGIVAMGTTDAEMANLKKSGNNVYERIVEFPMWEEYGDLIKSEVGDIKNIGGADGGAITAGKFLQHFVNYPWIHLDIAGPAFLESTDGYTGKGGTGVGVRLLFDFLREKSKKN
jgi:leucyl aminopeptidase